MPGTGRAPATTAGPPPPPAWGGRRPAGPPPPLGADAGHGLPPRTAGGPRSRPRHTGTVRMNLNSVHPLLPERAHHHSHLREITAGDVTAATTAVHGSLRRQTLTALQI